MMVFYIDTHMNSRYYKKRGSSFKERLRCPLCGKISEIGYFSQTHRFAIYRYLYAGRGRISVTEVQKSNELMVALRLQIVGRLLQLLKMFTGLDYVPEQFAYTQIKPNVVHVPNKIVPMKTVPSKVKCAKVVVDW
jgi:hypothetical protein